MPATPVGFPGEGGGEEEFVEIISRVYFISTYQLFSKGSVASLLYTTTHSINSSYPLHCVECTTTSTTNVKMLMTRHHLGHAIYCVFLGNFCILSFFSHPISPSYRCILPVIADSYTRGDVTQPKDPRPHAYSSEHMH